MIAGFVGIMVREMRQGLVLSGGGFLPTAFFSGAILILPFSIGPNPELLREIGPGYLWLALSLASLVSLERLFAPDIDDGTMDLFTIGSTPFPLVMLAKLLGQWCAVSLPLILAIPLAAFMLNIDSNMIVPLMLQLWVGSLAMFLLGGIGSALSAGVRRGGLLIALLSLPLYTPLVIFGAASANQIILGNGVFSQGFLFICGITLFAIVVCPIATSAAVKMHLD
jgi:heme exporter protein B